MTLKITQIDTRHDDATTAVQTLRAALSPDGNVVSERGRAKTLEVFGRELTPQQVVEQICQDVHRDGLSAVVRYSAQLDGAKNADRPLRVPTAELEQAHRHADPGFLQPYAEFVTTFWNFSGRSCTRTSQVTRPDGVYLQQRYVPLVAPASVFLAGRRPILQRC